MKMRSHFGTGRANFLIFVFVVVVRADNEVVADLETSASSRSASSPSILGIEAVCNLSHIDVSIQFDAPFRGVVYSKGFFHDPRCVHTARSSSRSMVNFRLNKLECGTRVSEAPPGQPELDGSFVENTIVVQFDPVLQEVFDQARRIRCNWFDYYEKDITFKPISVGQLNAITANFMGDDDLQCWMQIQVGKGPWAPEVDGIVRIGQTLTLVIGIKDAEDKFDLTVRDCIAHDGNGYNGITPITLVDDQGCVTRPKIMTEFRKQAASTSFATAVAFAHFQAFKFPDARSVHFQCTVQVCRFLCPETRCEPKKYARRSKRDLRNDSSIEIRPRAQMQVLASLEPFNNSQLSENFDEQNKTFFKEQRRKLCFSLIRPDTWILGLPFLTALLAVLVCCCIACTASRKSAHS